MAVHFNGVIGSFTSSTAKLVEPIVVERHRGLDLTLADIAVEFFRRVDAVEARAMAEDHL